MARSTGTRKGRRRPSKLSVGHQHQTSRLFKKMDGLFAWPEAQLAKETDDKLSVKCGSNIRSYRIGSQKKNGRLTPPPALCENN